MQAAKTAEGKAQMDDTQMGKQRKRVSTEETVEVLENK